MEVRPDSKVKPATVAEFADALEQEAWGERLAALLFSGSPQAREYPARLRVFGEHVRDHAALHQAIVTDSSTRTVVQAWHESLAAAEDPLDLLHALAVLYHESALMSEDTAKGQDYHRLGTALWMLLLGCPTFQAAFARQRIEVDVEDEKERVDLSSEQLADLLDRSTEKLCHEHSGLAASALRNGDTRTAGRHISCLHLVIDGEAALRATVAEFGIEFEFESDGERLGRAAEIARETLHAWSESAVHAATQGLSSMDIRPRGTDDELLAAIVCLAPLLDLGIASDDVLRFAVACVSDRAAVMRNTEAHEGAIRWLREAHFLAAALEERTDPGTSESPLNNELGDYYAAFAASLSDPGEILHACAAALKWDPENTHATNRQREARQYLASMGVTESASPIPFRGEHRAIFAEDAMSSLATPHPAVKPEFPGPFTVLELPADAPTSVVLERFRNLKKTSADTEALLAAVDKLTMRPEDRLMHELFEIPLCKYISHDRRWKRFCRSAKRSPVDVDSLLASVEAPSSTDLDQVELLRLCFRGWLAEPMPPLEPLLDNAPVEAGAGVLPLEVADALFT